MAESGFIIVVLTLATAIFSVVASLIGAKLKQEWLMTSSHIAVLLQLGECTAELLRRQIDPLLGP